MLHWIVLYSDTSSCGAIQSTFIFISQGVQTLTQEDRDINGWLHFLRCGISLSREQKLRPTRIRDRENGLHKSWTIDCCSYRCGCFNH